MFDWLTSLTLVNDCDCQSLKMRVASSSSNAHQSIARLHLNQWIRLTACCSSPEPARDLMICVYTKRCENINIICFQTGFSIPLLAVALSGI